MNGGLVRAAGARRPPNGRAQRRVRSAVVRHNASAVAGALCLAIAACSGDFGIDPVATKTAEFHDSSDVYSLAFSPDGEHIAVSSPNDETVHVWKWVGTVGTPQISWTLHQEGGGEINGLRYSPGGKLLASAHGTAQQDRIVRIWSTGDGAVAGDIAEAKSGAFPLKNAGLEFSNDGKSLMRIQGGGSYIDGSTRVFVDGFVVHDADNWDRKWALRTEPFHPDALNVSKDGRYAAIAGWERLMRGGEVQRVPTKLLLIDLANRQERSSTEILVDNCSVGFVVWSPDGHRIAVGGTPGGEGAPALEILDADTAMSAGTFPAKSNMVALDYSPDGKYLLVGWGNVGVELWDAAHTKLLQRIPGHPTAARFSDDGRHLGIAAGRDVTIYDMK